MLYVTLPLQDPSEVIDSINVKGETEYQRDWRRSNNSKYTGVKEAAKCDSIKSTLIHGCKSHLKVIA